MKRVTKIAIAAGAAISLGLAAATVSASPFGYGPGWHMGGWGPAAGYAMGPGMMYGYGPGYGMGPGMMYGYGGGYYGMGPGMMYGYGAGYPMGPQAMFGGYFGNADGNLAALKSQLGITDKQEGAWQDFAKSAKQQSSNRQAWFEKMQQAGSRDKFIAQQQAFFKQRQADLEASSNALNKLYAALSPQQKQIADQSFGGYGPAYCLQGFGAWSN
jgi:LTXXQ motif family protein